MELLSHQLIALVMKLLTPRVLALRSDKKIIPFQKQLYCIICTI